MMTDPQPDSCLDRTQAPHTPALLLDHDRMQRNIERLNRRLAGLGVPIRPHVKTAKSIEVAARMVDDRSPGITVSTLAEAEYFADHGFVDQIYAVGIAPAKLDRVAGLIARGVTLRIILDAADSARQVVAAARRLRCRFDVVLEIDTDGARGGLRPDAPNLVEIARLLQDGGCDVTGVLTHMGASYHCFGPEALADAAETERAAAVQAAARLRAAGHDCSIVSVGSTPTALFARQLDGISEVRAGTHVFMDLVQAGLGVCDVDDIALSVLAEVIGYRAELGEWLIDAGWTALSADRGTANQPIDHGYGLVCDPAGRPIRDLIVRAVSQEHGIVARRDGQPAANDTLEIGQRLRIVPNHACATAAQFDEYQVIGGAIAPGTRWPRMRGW